jgi:hypothetical protein
MGPRAPVVEVPEARHHVMLDQPLGFVAALRMLLDSWIRNESAEGSGYAFSQTGLRKSGPCGHPATGGDGSLACSADMLLEALVACADVTMSAVATAMGVKLRGGRVIAEVIGTRVARSAWTARCRSASPISR